MQYEIFIIAICLRWGHSQNLYVLFSLHGVPLFLLTLHKQYIPDTIVLWDLFFFLFFFLDSAQDHRARDPASFTELLIQH